MNLMKNTAGVAFVCFKVMKLYNKRKEKMNNQQINKRNNNNSIKIMIHKKCSAFKFFIYFFSVLNSGKYKSKIFKYL